MPETRTRAQMTMGDRIRDLRQRKADLFRMGGEEHIGKQHEQGKLTAGVIGSAVAAGVILSYFAA